MPFDPATFEAEITLKIILTERLPSVAQDALEAGFDGPHVLRMAILEPVAGWAIDQAVPPMMEELGLQLIAPEEAALRLARKRGQRILETGEDPLPSVPYFNRLMEESGYIEGLLELGYFDDDESLDPAKIEVVGIGRDSAELPDQAGVVRMENDAAGPRRPGDPVADIIDTAKVSNGTGVLELPLSRYRYRGQEQRN